MYFDKCNIKQRRIYVAFCFLFDRYLNEKLWEWKLELSPKFWVTLTILNHINNTIIWRYMMKWEIEFEYEHCVSRFALLRTSCQMKKTSHYSKRRKIMIKKEKSWKWTRKYVCNDNVQNFDIFFSTENFFMSMRENKLLTRNTNYCSL